MSAARPVSSRVMLRGSASPPSATAAVVRPRAAVVPYSNQALAATPAETALPVAVTPLAVAPSAVAGPTPGPLGAVVKAWSAPVARTPGAVATSR